MGSQGDSYLLHGGNPWGVIKETTQIPKGTNKAFKDLIKKNPRDSYFLQGGIPWRVCRYLGFNSRKLL